jgi:hypothetical protein
MRRPLAPTDAQPDRAILADAQAERDAAPRAETFGSGIFRGLRASLTKRKQAASMDISPATDVVRAQANMEVAPGEGVSRFQFLDVRNLGKEAIFHATGQIVSAQNTNSALTSVYPLGWGRDRDAWVAIPKGEIRQILIATVGEVYGGSLFHMALIQAGPSLERHWARWNAQDKLPLPRFGLKVSIIAEGADESWTGYFSVTPENEEGVGVRLIFRGRQGPTGVV